MLHSPSSFEVSKPLLAGISRCVQENSSNSGRLSLHSHSMISCCYHSAPMRQRLTLLLTCSIRSRRQCRAWLASCCSRDSSWPRGFLVGMRISTWGSMNARKPRSCNNRLPAGKGVGRRLGDTLIMDAAATGVTEKEDGEQGIDQQDIFYRVVF